MSKSVSLSSSPNTGGATAIMRDVLIALSPAVVMAIFWFGLRGAMLITVSVISCVGFEFFYRKSLKKSVTVTDLSAVVTGVLIALNMPPGVPLWVPVLGAFFAIIIVKQLFGGLGQNFVNPALAATAFLMAAYPMIMNDFSYVFYPFSPDSFVYATPMAQAAQANFTPTFESYFTQLIQNPYGTVGQVTQITLILGGAYLLVRRVISWHIPCVFIVTAALMFWVFGHHGLFTGLPHFEILLGGIMLGAFFLATDHSTSPATPLGKIIFGAGCGVLTVVIRLWGSFPVSVTYAILFMNLLVPLIDKFTQHKISGEVKQNA